MDTLISVYDLLLFIVFVVLMVICVLIIRFLFSLNQLIKRVNEFINKNHNNISQTLGTLPETIKNVNEMSLSIKAGADKAGVAVKSIETTLANTFDSAGQSTGGFLTFIAGMGNVIKAISRFFSKEAD